MAYPVSPNWERFIRRGFRPITRVDVHYPDVGVVFEDLPVSSGSISFSRGQAIRGSGRVTVPDPKLFPAFRDDSPIAPYGTELHIRTGILFPEAAEKTHLTSRELEASGLAEMVPMGIFIITEASGSEKAGNVTDISFSDRAFLIEHSEHVFPEDYGGLSAFEVLEEIVLDQGTARWILEIDSGALEDITLPVGTTFDTGRWAFIDSIVEALGAEIFFGRDGNAHCGPIPGVTPENEDLDIDWVIDAGRDGVLIDVSRQISRNGVYNGVVVTGSADEDRPQPFAFVTDDDPNSRTFYGGPFGRLVRRIDNSNLTTTEDCERAARAALRDLTGLQRSVGVETFGNPAIDPGDIIMVQSLQGPDEIHMVDSYTYDFASAAQNITTRSIQFIHDEE